MTKKIVNIKCFSFSDKRRLMVTTVIERTQYELEGSDSCLFYYPLQRIPIFINHFSAYDFPAKFLFRRWRLFLVFI